MKLTKRNKKFYQIPIAPSTRNDNKNYRSESLYLVIRLRSFQLGDPVRRGIDGDRLLLERDVEAFEGVDDEEDEEDEDDEDEEEEESESDDED